MRNLYILLTRSNTIASRIIYQVTGASYTHSSLCFDTNFDQLYSFGRKYARLPLPAGFRIETLEQGFYKNNCHIPCALYQLEVEDEVYEAAQREVARMVEDISSYRYSIMGLAFCHLGIARSRPNKYFCSEFVAEVLSNSNALDLPKVPSLIHPNDYTRLPGLSCLFEGRIETLLAYRDAGHLASIPS